MKEYTISVGGSGTHRSGAPIHHDNRNVVFHGLQVAEVCENSDENRTTTDTLYELADGRYVVVSAYRTAWAGELSTTQLYVFSKAELESGDHFQRLARAAGLMSDELTIDEYLIWIDHESPYG